MNGKWNETVDEMLHNKRVSCRFRLPGWIVQLSVSFAATYSDFP